jgi:hypothetical protein
LIFELANPLALPKRFPNRVGGGPLGRRVSRPGSCVRSFPRFARSTLVSFFSLSERKMKSLVDTVARHGEAGERAEAMAAAGPLRRRVKQREVAGALVELVQAHAFTAADALRLLKEVFAAHGDDNMLAAVGCAFEAAHDVGLNDEPLSDPIADSILKRMCDRAEATRGTDAEVGLICGIKTVAQILGRSRDDAAERANQRLLEIRPGRWEDHYNWGFFLKVRGRFAEGRAANARAIELGGDEQRVHWNLGICATGAGEAAAALAVWKAIGQKVETGRFGLPEGTYLDVEVRLAQRPVAERKADEDDPGEEETVWIERLSPCHGVVRSALYADSIGVDYGDVVLFDGAPITYEQDGDRQVPVFPHLATLVRSNYLVVPFAATQRTLGAILELSRRLPEDSVLFPHAEEEVLPGGTYVVRGKLCAPPSVAPAALRAALDEAVASSDGIRLFVPALSERLGDRVRAEVEARQLSIVDSA